MPVVSVRLGLGGLEEARFIITFTWMDNVETGLIHFLQILLVIGAVFQLILNEYLWVFLFFSSTGTLNWARWSVHVKLYPLTCYHLVVASLLDLYGALSLFYSAVHVLIKYSREEESLFYSSTEYF